MRNFPNLIGLEQWYFSLIWNTYMWKLQTFSGSQYKEIIAWFVCDIWQKYHLWYFKIVSNFTRLTAHEITYNNFEISLVVFMPNITTNHAITYTNLLMNLDHINVIVFVWFWFWFCLSADLGKECPWWHAASFQLFSTSRSLFNLGLLSWDIGDFSVTKPLIRV